MPFISGTFSEGIIAGSGIIIPERCVFYVTYKPAHVHRKKSSARGRMHVRTKTKFEYNSKVERFEVGQSA